MSAKYVLVLLNEIEGKHQLQILCIQHWRVDLQGALNLNAISSIPILSR